MKSKQEILAWEARWSMPAALATLAAVGCVIAAIFVARASSGDGEAEPCCARSSSIAATACSPASCRRSAILLLAAPLYFLFRAAQVAQYQGARA